MYIYVYICSNTYSDIFPHAPRTATRPWFQRTAKDVLQPSQWDAKLTEVPVW